MKTLNITFDDSEFVILESKKEKSGKNWHDFFLDCSGASKEMQEKKAAAEWRLKTGF